MTVIRSTANSSSDTDYDSEESLTSVSVSMIDEFCADRMTSLPREDTYALSLLLFHILQQNFQLLVYPSSKIIAKYVNKNYKIVQKWRVHFLKNKGEIPEFLHGRHKQMGVVWNDEALTKVARQYVRWKWKQ